MEEVILNFHRWLIKQGIPDLQLETLLDLNRVHTILQERHQSASLSSRETDALIEQYAELLKAVIGIQTSRNFMREHESRRLIEE